jgi:NAD(P)-dependent dehydrogenase (short-subunit alcohol dehydrogenase family)
VITGGTGALGGAVTRLFVAEGARVAVPCRRVEDAQALREELGDRADVLLAERVDVTNGAELTRFIDGAVDKLGRLDNLVNVIGGFAGGRPLYETDETTWDHMMALNLGALGEHVRRAWSVVAHPGRALPDTPPSIRLALQHPALVGRILKPARP